MTYLLAAFIVVILTVAGYLIAHRLLPALVRTILRRLGYRVHLTPLMARRVRRFRSIRRGYWSFVVITSLFMVSLFLEILVNDDALLLWHRGRWASPAVREWSDKWVPFVDFPSFEPGDRWGFHESGPFRHREYTVEGVEHRIEKEDAALALAQEKFATLEKPPELAEPPRPKPPVEPTPPGDGATQEERDAYGKERRKYESALSDYEFELEMWAIEAEEFRERIERVREVHERKVKEYEFYRKDLETRRAIIEHLAALREDLASGEAGVVMPLYPFGPQEHILDIEGIDPPYRPGQGGLLLGATDNGKDVLVQLAYGFRISIVFASIVAGVGYTIGTLFGGIMGYYGGTLDILMQRFVEIWESIPFLFTIMIIVSIMSPGLLLLALLLIVLRSWLGITYTIRGEFYREKAKDYVQAAIAMGASDWKIITRHILPNSLVPLVSFAPFGVVAYISVLVSLDYLGLGLPPGTPSWGYLLDQGRDYITEYPHLILIPACALAATLFCVVIIGESVREAFDPKVFSRLR